MRTFFLLPLLLHAPCSPIIECAGGTEIVVENLTDDTIQLEIFGPGLDVEGMLATSNTVFTSERAMVSRASGETHIRPHHRSLGSSLVPGNTEESVI